jgi:subtilisin family serine protease
MSKVLVSAAVLACSGVLLLPGAALADTAAQPYLATIDYPRALPVLAPVKVAVIDSGVDGTHPDLQGRIIAARSFTGQQPLYPDDPHGTATAGLIGAIAGNSEGIDGLAPNAELLVARISTARGSYQDSALRAAIDWAVESGARVINMSLEGFLATPALDGALRNAARRNVLVVAASGNCWGCGSLQRSGYPASSPYVLSVGATDETDSGPRVATFSDWNHVDLVAPGQYIATLWPTLANPYSPTRDCLWLGTTSCYQTGLSGHPLWGPSGTSFATPMVSAAAALLLGACPRQTATALKRTLTETARRLPDESRAAQGSGLLDVAAALRASPTCS